MSKTNTFMPDLHPDDRLDYMRNNCDAQETRKYMKQLSAEELDIKRETATNDMITLSVLAEELDLIKKDFKEKMLPHQVSQKQLLTQIKTKQEEVDGTLYLFADQEAGKMFTYDENGEEVESRRLRPEERQMKVFPLKKAMGE